MNNIIVEKYVLGLFLNLITSSELRINNYLVEKSNHDLSTNLHSLKREVIISSDLRVVICLLRDMDNRITVAGIFNLVNNNYLFNKTLSLLINNIDEILNIVYSTANEHIVIIRRRYYTYDEGKSYADVLVSECNYIDDKKKIPYMISVPLGDMNSCLIGSTGIMLHDGSGLLLLGDPLVTGRVVTEENGFGTKGSIFIFKHNKEGKSIEYVDQLCVNKEDKFNFNPYFTIDHEIATNIKINYTPDGEGVGKSHNMRYLVDNIGSYRYINFARYLKSNYR